MIKLRAIFPKIEVKFLNDPPEWKKLVEIGPNKFDPQENVRIRTFFQSIKFADIYNKTLSYFNESLLTAARRFIDKAKHNYKTFLKTIFIKEINIIKYLCTCQKRRLCISSKLHCTICTRYQKCNELHAKQIQIHTVFIVISNNLKWSRVNLNQSNVYFSNLTSDQWGFCIDV